MFIKITFNKKKYTQCSPNLRKLAKNRMSDHNV